MRGRTLYPEPDQRGRGKKGKAADAADFSQRRLRETRSALAHSRDLAVAIRDGTVTIDAAMRYALSSSVVTLVTPALDWRNRYPSDLL